MDPQQGPPQPDLLIGQTIGNYLVTQRLGEGGMGAVYLAEHPAIGKKVALKVLHSEYSNNQEVTARFFTEAKAVNDIGHPNIVDIVDFGILQAGAGREQLVYFIMEYLAGMTLSQLIRSEAPLPPERALSIGLQVADALSASHKCGIVHRDLKPDNIILLQRGRERDFVKLLDFGIAKLTGGSAMGSHQTRTGLVMGTPAYMSPEQCEGRPSVDERTDIYALGIVLYEMLTGRVPFQGEGYGEILVQHLTQRPAPMSQFRMLPPHVEVMVLKALEKRAEMRYPKMDEFMRAMADPVGYVEAHGGVGGFLAAQLMPSNAPLPSVRFAPAPLTPLPGSLVAPGTASMPGLATPAPTTLGSAAGQVQPSRGKAGYIVTGVVIVAAAAAAIVALVGKDKPQAASSGSDVAIVDRGSAAAGATGSAAIAGSAGTTPVTGIAATGAGSAVATAGSDQGSAAAGPGSPGAAMAGSGSAAAGGSAGPGEAGAGSAQGSAAPTTPTIPESSVAKITVTSRPPGAQIFVDSKDTGKLTPDTLELPRAAGGSVSITLRRKGYDDFTFKSVELGESSQQAADLVKAKAGGPAAAKCRLPERPGCTRDAKGCCAPEGTTGGRTGTGTKNGSGAQDPDGLMRP